jgi:retron-type reverse transcriptase
MEINNTDFNILLDNNKVIMSPKILYSDVIAINNLRDGYTRTKGNKSPGIDGITKATITAEHIAKLHKELKAQKYRPNPSKRVGIPKPDGGIRYLGVASQRDKVVQAALLNFLEKRFEEIFLETSKGFRPGKNCHEALKEIKHKWQCPTWIINLDLKKCFDKLNHNHLLIVLAEHCDQATIELVAKLIKVGYVDIHNLNDRQEYSVEGTPQGSLISPILCNIYLHSFDLYVIEKLLPTWTRGVEKPFKWEYTNRKSFIDSETTRKILLEDLPELKSLEEFPELISRLATIEQGFTKKDNNRYVKWEEAARETRDENFRRLYYIRYADDFLIGFSGTKSEVSEIRKDVETKLNEIHLKVNKEKSKTFHNTDDGLLYLGVYIRFISSRKICRDSKKVGSLPPRLKAISMNNAQFRIPIKRILNRAVERGHAKVRKDGTYRATSKRAWSSLTEKQIVVRYSSIIRGIIEYYTCANQRSDLWPIVNLYRKSCALVLADKLKLKTAARVFKKFGPRLTIRNAIGRMETVLTYPVSLKTKVSFKTGKAHIQVPQSTGDVEAYPMMGSHKQNQDVKLVCAIPECVVTEGLEIHHINPMVNVKETGLARSQIRNSRKKVPLCSVHHHLTHKGTATVQLK